MEERRALRLPVQRFYLYLGCGNTRDGRLQSRPETVTAHDAMFRHVLARLAGRCLDENQISARCRNVDASRERLLELPDSKRGCAKHPCHLTVVTASAQYAQLRRINFRDHHRR